MTLRGGVRELFWVAAQSSIGEPDDYFACRKVKDKEDQFEDYETGKIIKRPSSAIVGQIPSEVSLKDIPSDLVNADDISEPSVLWSLKKRFSQDLIYSAIGPIIIAINPYRVIDTLYSPQTMQQYLSSSASSGSVSVPKLISSSSSLGTEDPHLQRIQLCCYVCFWVG